jgi:hypothetical protein
MRQRLVTQGVNSSAQGYVNKVIDCGCEAMDTRAMTSRSARNDRQGKEGTR